MNLTKYKLGDLIVQRREKNNNYDVPIRGVSKEGFIPAKQKDADTSIYNVFYKYDFVFNPARMELNSIALNLEYDKALCSSLYEVFYVKDKSIVLPEFLNLHIKRDEFARHCDYIGLGSAREYCRFANIAEFDIELPPIEVQEEIVEADRLIKKRIRLNNQMIQHLEATAQALYRKTFVDNIDKENLPKGWRMGTLGEVAYYVDEKMSLANIDETAYIATENMLKDKKGIIISTNKPEEGRGTKFAIDDVLVSNIRPYFKKIWRASFNGVSSNDVLCFRAKNEFNASMLYYTIEQDVFFDYVMAGSNGVKMPRGDKKWIMNYPVIIPSKNGVKEYEKATTCIHLQSVCRKQENSKLTELQSLLLAKMGHK